MIRPHNKNSDNRVQSDSDLLSINKGVVLCGFMAVAHIEHDSEDIRPQTSETGFSDSSLVIKAFFLFKFFCLQTNLNKLCEVCTNL